MTQGILLPFPRCRRSPEVSEEMAAKMKTMIRLGLNQHDIAAHFGVNQGRVSEVKHGLRHPNVPPAPVDHLFN